MNFYKYKIKYYPEEEVTVETDQGIVLGDCMEDAISVLKSYYTAQEDLIDDISITLLVNPEYGEVLPLAKETLKKVENEIIW